MGDGGGGWGGVVVHRSLFKDEAKPGDITDGIE